MLKIKTIQQNFKSLFPFFGSKSKYSLESSVPFLLIFNVPIERFMYVIKGGDLLIDQNRSKKSIIPVTINRHKLKNAMFTDHYLITKSTKVYACGLTIKKVGYHNIFTIKEAFSPISESDSIFQEVVRDKDFRVDSVRKSGSMLILDCSYLKKNKERFPCEIKLYPHRKMFFFNPFRMVENEYKKLNNFLKNKKN